MATQTQTEPPQLTVSNLGPIAKAEIDLRPLTVFVGPSNTGKSYLAILIYALHRFFGGYAGIHRFKGFRRRHPILRRIVKEPLRFDDNDIKQLADWISDVGEAKSGSEPSPIQLPDFIESKVRLVLNDLSDVTEILTGEIRRSFGIESTARLIRHDNREGVKITLQFKPLEYKLTLKKVKREGGVIFSEETPLYVNVHTGRMESIRLRALDVLNTPNPSDDDEKRLYAEYFLRDLASSVLSDVVSPLSNTAHYLPAGRSGVMNAHRVVVASWMERASQVGTLLPTLSGVLTDFLLNLVELDDSPSSEFNYRNLATSLEGQILKGEIHRKNSEAGYPMFSYQPKGWREDLPLMNASSMVSELAPVVLYLRHIVQPGDVLIIEEPESHLHPAMQVEFIRQLAAVVHSGIRVMLTTHSEWVLDELTNLVRLWDLPKTRRKGIAGADFALNPDEVGVWLFEPKQKPKGSVVKEIPFDAEFGGFRSGFDKVALGTYNDYAEISNRIERSE